MMNHEELERKMVFVVNQQAQFAVDMDKLRAAQAKTEEVVTRLAFVTNVGFKELELGAKINALVDAQVRSEDNIRRLAESQKKTEETLNAKFSELADSQKKTDEEFRKLIGRLNRRSNNGGNTD